MSKKIPVNYKTHSVIIGRTNSCWVDFKIAATKAWEDSNSTIGELIANQFERDNVRKKVRRISKELCQKGVLALPDQANGSVFVWAGTEKQATVVRMSFPEEFVSCKVIAGKIELPRKHEFFDMVAENQLLPEEVTKRQARKRNYEKKIQRLRENLE